MNAADNKSPERTRLQSYRSYMIEYVLNLRNQTRQTHESKLTELSKGDMKYVENMVAKKMAEGTESSKMN